MAATSSRYFSVRLMRFLMSLIGFWRIRTREEQLWLRLNYAKMFIAVGICFLLALSELFYYRHDFYEATYFACCTIPPFVIIIKAISFTFRRKELLWLIEQSQNHFWYKEYDVFEKKVMDSLDKKATLLMCTYMVSNIAVAMIYVVLAVVESISNLREERVHPFTWRFFNLPSTRTPYYEILFMAETIIIIYTALCYCCFDNTLYMLCMLISEQFKILQNKFGTIFDSCGGESGRSYRMFKSCVVYHHLLISYVQKLECVFSVPLMSQLLISSIVLCVSGFQLTMDIAVVKKFMFLIYVFAALLQIFLITLYCDNITEQSDAIGRALYSCNWEGTSYGKFHQLRKDIVIVMLRSRRPCYMTAAKFFPISIESFTKVLSTTASYFTLLRTMDVND